MKKLTIVAFVAIAVAVGASAWLLSVATSGLSQVARIDSLREINGHTSAAFAATITMSDAVRGFLLDQTKTDELTRKKAADANATAAFEALDKLPMDDKSKALAAAIAKADDDVLDPLEDSIMEIAKTDVDRAIKVYWGEYMPARREQVKRIDAFEAAAREQLDGAITAANTSFAATAKWAMWGALTVFAVLIGAGILAYRAASFTTRQIATAVTELTSTSNQVASASGQIASSSQSLSQGATEQAASLEETSASMEEMASMTRKNAENSQTAAALMGEVDMQVQASNGALGEMVSSMSAIEESSQQVAKIIKTIDEIAFQTNILALNAAVEAARAGEAGMGFAVVADEVRNLAQRSAQAAKDTAGLIEASVAKSQAGSAKVTQVAASITAITDSVGKVKGLVDEVSVASRQQTQGIDQVSQAIAQMEKVTQTTAATAEENAASGEELSAQAETSLAIVGRLNALVGGTSTAKPPAPQVRVQDMRRRKAA